MNNSYGSVKYGTVRKALRQIKKQCENVVNDVDDIDISFEFLVGSFFPEILDNIREFGKDQYIQGYNDGKADKENKKNE